MFKKHLFFLLVCCFSSVYTQQNVQLSNFSEISIITSGPGNVIYEKFGHTAIRIKDPMLKLDLIYNYGIFDFDDPNFILNFTKGYMKYKLARYPFHYSVRSAQEDGRWMKEQILNLTNEEKNNFFRFLEINASPKNASYLYDPFFNNCATKPRDIINKILSEKIIWNDNYTFNASFRTLMNKEINQNTWGSVGINIALGSKLDRKATSSEYLYLPDYVSKALASATIKRNKKVEKLVLKTETILDFKEKKSKRDTVSPFLIFSFILLFGGYITFKDYQKNTRSRWFDFSLFFVTGLAGCILLFLWFFTNHSTAPNNFNLLWLFPVNVIIGVYLVRKTPPKWTVKYIFSLLILLLFIPFAWAFKLQVFNWTLLPLFILLAVRYVFLQKTLNC